MSLSRIPAIAMIFASALMLTAATAAAADAFNFAPKSPSAATKKALNEARTDFDAVVQGRLPRYAKLNKEAALPADGGTAFYKGHGYSLTIVKQITRLGDVDGYLYGPVLTFEPTLISGNGDTLSDVRFFSTAAMQKLLGSSRQAG